MEHTQLVGYLTAIAIVLFIIWRNSSKSREDK
jgi:hypothetical protein